MAPCRAGLRRETMCVGRTKTLVVHSLAERALQYSTPSTRVYNSDSPCSRLVFLVHLTETLSITVSSLVFWFSRMNYRTVCVAAVTLRTSDGVR